MDLYHPGDYVGELTIGLVPAGGDADLDRRSPTPRRHEPDSCRSIFTLARSLAPAPDGAAEPEGWGRSGLTQLGYGNYAVTQQADDQGRDPPRGCRQVRLTNSAGRAPRLARRPFLGHVRLHGHRRPGDDQRLRRDRGPDRGRLVPALLNDLGLFATAGHPRPQSAPHQRNYLPWKRPTAGIRARTANSCWSCRCPEGSGGDSGLGRLGARRAARPGALWPLHVGLRIADRGSGLGHLHARAPAAAAKAPMATSASIKMGIGGGLAHSSTPGASPRDRGGALVGGPQASSGGSSPRPRQASGP